MTDVRPHITVLKLNQLLSDAIAATPEVRGVWVEAETSDVRVSGGHCYMELVQKDEQGRNVSRIRAIAWASVWRVINARFLTATGSELTSGLKVLMCVTASYHPTYGMAVNISDIDPSFTLGDAVRRRNEIVAQLTSEGLINMNRELRWPYAPQRVAVVSARGAAGFGDFINHLFTTPARLRFSVDLYPAVMQGTDTVPTVMAALDAIRSQADRYDVVVIIRGGGSTSDLAAFDDYTLARAVATMPIPVIVGIGHERDVTVLDFVGFRVKTPTAAAEHLIGRVTTLLDGLGRFAERMYRAATIQIQANRELLAHASASLPGTVRSTLTQRRAQLDRAALTLASTAGSVLTPRMERLGRMVDDIARATATRLSFARGNLNYYSEMITVLSPDRILARGFSITTDSDGHTITDSENVSTGTILTTRLKNGTLTSTII